MKCISIVMPVYKAEKYICRAIDSIIAQSFTDWELIIVDDGSPDRSGEICEAYSAKDDRIRVFHKPNGGVTSARIFGVGHVEGIYTIHFDPDDYAEPNYLELLYNKAKELDADMVICDFYKEYSSKRVICEGAPASCDHLEVYRSLLGQNTMGSLWNKLIRTSLYNRVGVSFPPESVILWEDLWVVASMCLHPITIAAIREPLYHYDVSCNSNSIVRTYSRKSAESLWQCVKHFEKITPNPELYSEELFLCKGIVKERHYVCDESDKEEIESIYSEINQEYISRNGRLRLDKPLRFCVAMSLKGHWECSKLIYSFLTFIHPFGHTIAEALRKS